MHSTRRAFLSLALLAASAGACGREAADRTSSPADALLEGGTAVVGLPSGPTSPFPPLAAAAVDAEIGAALYPGLNHAVWADGRLAFPEGDPLALASSWEADGPRLTYHLRAGLVWSDGAPVRGDDVVFTYGLLADPEGGLPMSAAAARLDSVRASDDSTVTFFFDRPYPGMLFDSGVGILPRHAYGRLELDELRALPARDPSAAAGLVVSGPFRLQEWTPGDRFVLGRNEEGTVSPRLDRVVFRVLPDETTRLAALRSGEIDLAQVNSFGAARRLAEDPGVRLAAMPQRGYDYIAWNPGAFPAFAERDVRRALSLAIDRAEVIRATDMEGFAVEAYGPYGPLFTDLAPQPPDGVVHDAAEAGRLLTAAGWTDGDGDGVREKKGDELRFELITAAGNERRERAAQIIQRQLAEVGVAVTVRTQEFASLFGRAQKRDYEAALLGWQVGLDPDISFFWYDPHSPVNLVGYDNPDVRALMDSALAAPTAAEAAPYWRRSAEVIAADYPYAFLWYIDLLVAIGPRLGGVETDPVGFAGTIHEWGILAAGSPGASR
ncbi:MAG: ABC transporter substrate-binding protein [Gemmatimonadota bacterium]